MTINGIEYSVGTPTYILDENFRCFRPEKLTTVAVDGDNDSSAIILKTPRYYKNLDLSQISAWIYWSTEWLDDEGKPSRGKKELVDFEVGNEEIVYLWLLDIAQTYKKGKVNFGIGWTDGGDWELNTKGNYFVVQKFVDTLDSYVAPDIAELLQYQIDKLKENKADKLSLDNHIADKNNPHEVTKAQIGLSNVENTSDADKPISTATQAALNLKADKSSTYTKTEVDNALNLKANITYVDQQDNALQEQIDVIASSSDVVDVVGTYAELEAYDTQHLKNNDIVKVLQDETKEDAITYYRWVIINHVGSWDYIGSSGPYYTKSETDALLDEKQNTLTAGENITIENGVISAASGGTVDQHYDPTSENAQSGVAVAEALRTIPTGGVGEKTEERGEIFNILEAQALFTPVIDNNDLVKFNANVDEYARFEYTKGWSTITAGSYTFTMDCHIYSGTPVIQVGADVTGSRLPEQENYIESYDAEHGKYIITFDLTSDFSGNLGARIGNYGTDGIFVCAHPRLVKEGTTENILNEFNSNYYSSSRTANKWARKQSVSSGGYECFVLNGDTASNIIESINGINNTNLKAGYLSHAEGEGTWATAKMAHAEGRGNNFECTLTSYSGTTVTLSPKNGSDVSSIRKNAVLFIEYDVGSKFFFAQSRATSNGNNTYNVTINDIVEAINTPANVKVIMGGSTSSLAHTEGNFTNAVDLTATDLEDTADNKTRQHAEGSRTLAAGYAAHAEGEYTQALANHSHAGGEGTIADETGETAIGRYNNPQSGDLFEVGNGSNDNNRSNAFRVTQRGKAIVGANTVDTDSDLTLATKKYVDDSSLATNILLNYIDWQFDVEGNCTITGLKSGVQTTDLVGSFIIPEEIEGHMVTKIGVNAFKNCYNITDIIIPNTVKVIDEGAFSGCRGISSIIIPDSVTSIHYKAFEICMGLERITLSAQLISIGEYAFRECGLTSITIPDTVTTIGSYAFFSCTQLRKVKLPKNITSINREVFYGCNSLDNVVIPENVQTIGYKAFGYCDNLHNISLPKSLLTIGNSAFNGSTLLNKVLYSGTQTEWENINIGTFNEPLINATIYYNQEYAKVQDVLDYHDSTKQNITDNTLNTTNKTIPTAINEVYAMALGSQTGIAYTDYKSMIDTFNILPADDFFVGKDIYIQTVDVPDLWIESNDESTSVPYDIFSHLTDSEAPTFVANKYYEKISNEYVVLTTEPANWSTNWTDYYFVDDDSFVNTLETNGYVQVGYYKLAKLETGKVDLEDYYNKTQTDNLLASKLTEPSSNLAVGKWFRIASIDNDGHAVLECVDAPTPVTLTGTTAPTTSTVGYVGQKYIKTTKNQMYECVAISNGSYTWKEIILNNDIRDINLNINGNTSYNNTNANILLTPNLDNDNYVNQGYANVAIGKYVQITRSNYSTAIGHWAVINNADWAIQLGKGNNSTANTFNVGLSRNDNYRLLEADGTIPYDRINPRKTTLDQVLVPNANYDLGSTAQVSLTLTLPTPTANDNYSCNDIYVAFKSGSTATVLSIVGTYEGDTSYLPSADSICELSFKYICGTWVLVTKETAISST